ncbi:MAG: hypothetical protein LC656_03245 [Sphingomonadales bacterium]|nr:hypothetical protein [Sphingomonadales bacterium]
MGERWRAINGKRGSRALCLPADRAADPHPLVVTPAHFADATHGVMMPHPAAVAHVMSIAHAPSIAHIGVHPVDGPNRRGLVGRRRSCGCDGSLRRCAGGEQAGDDGDDKFGTYIRV